MAILHAQSGEVVDIRPFGDELAEMRTFVLIKSHHCEVIRMVILAGKEFAEHQAKGDVVVQCIEGSVLITLADKEVELNSGQLIYLKTGERHAVKASVNSSLLLTMLLHCPT